MQKKIGLFGGTFDPVHNTHIAIAEAAHRQLGLDEVWFLADKHPRYKPNATDYDHRLNMLRLATLHNKSLIADVLPVQKNGATHGINTFRKLQNDYPGSSFVIITGLDSILHLPNWDDYKEFIASVDFAVVKRPSQSLDDFNQMIEELTQKSLKLNYRFIDIEPSEISSTSIRSNKKSDVHPHVANYIAKNKLY